MEEINIGDKAKAAPSPKESLAKGGEENMLQPPPLTIDESDSIETVLNAMKSFPDNASVQEQSLSQLHRVIKGLEWLEDPSSNYYPTLTEYFSRVLPGLDHRSKIQDAGGIPLVIAALQKYTDSTSIQERAQAVLLGLITIRPTDGVGKVVEAMRKYPSIRLVQEQGCLTLATLTFGSNSYMARSEIESTGGLKVVLDAMKNHAESIKVLAAACQALQNAAVNANNRVKITKFGGVEVVLSLLDHSRDSLDFQARACMALFNLIQGNEKGRKVFVEVDGVHTVMQCVKRNQDSSLIVLHGCGVLKTVASSAETCKLIVHAGAVPMVLFALKNHLAADEEGELLGFLTQLASCEDAQAEILDAIEPMVEDVTGNYSEARGVQSQICAFLGTLAKQSDKSRSILFQSGASELGRDAFVRFPGLVSPRRLLKELGRPIPNAPAATVIPESIQSDKDCERVATLMAHYSGDAGFQENCCRVLNENLPNIAWQNNGERVPLLLHQALVNFPESTVIQEVAKQALEKLAPTSKISLALTRNIDTLVGYLKIYPSVRAEIFVVLTYRARLSAQDRLAIENARVLEFALLVIAENIDSDTLVPPCCHLLRHVLSLESTISAELRGRGASCMVDLMKRNQNSQPLNEDICAVLYCLLNREHNMDEDSLRDCTTTVIQSMGKHFTSVFLQERACGILACLASHAPGQTTVVESGGVQAIVACLKTYPGSGVLVEIACNALRNLAEGIDQPFPDADDVINTVLVALSGQAASLRVQGSVVCALAELTPQAPNNLSSYRMKSVARALLEAIAHSGFSVETKVCACRGVRNLIRDNDSSKDLIARLGGGRVVLMAMNERAECLDFQLFAVEILLHLAGASDGWKQVWNYIDVLIVVLQKNADCEELQVIGFKLLKDLSDTKKAMKNAGVDELAQKALERFPELLDAEAFAMD